MLKSYLTSQGITTYRLSKTSHVPYSTVNDLVNLKLPIENLRSGQLKALADALKLSMNELYDICQIDKAVQSEHHSVKANVIIEHKTYYLAFERKKQQYKYELLPVKQEATTYIDTLAAWKLDEIIDRIEMEEAYEALCPKEMR